MLLSFDPYPIANKKMKIGGVKNQYFCCNNIIKVL